MIPNVFVYMIATLQVERIADAVNRFHVDCGRYPKLAEGLPALVQDPAIRGWKGHI